MITAYIGIGSNLGDREKNIDEAIALLNSVKSVKVTKISSIYRTAPVGGPAQGDYLNGVIEINTTFAPFELLEFLNKIEEKLGRERREVNGPRTMDLDILLYDGTRINDSRLTIPHPRMFEREFVMRGLREIAPNFYEDNYRN
jgi:2-amino-4-hydroxy-6-hydroxymethyldihydropteridine diphosphokinase